MAQKINSDIMKQNNRKEVLRLIRKEPCSRIKLAEKMGLTRAAISFICEELIAEGFLVEGEKEASIGGRPATVLRLNSDYGVFCGVHFTRSGYVVGVCDFSGNVKKEKKGTVDASNVAGTLQKIQGDLKGLLENENRLIGIGITAPGPLLRKKGTLGDVPNFSAWNQFPLVEYFEKAFGCKCVLDNFSNALAYAECLQNPDCERRYLELIVDSGFGSAVAVVKNGISLLECELGHTSVNMFGEKCDCGNIGCAELYVNERKYHGSERERETFYSALASVIVNAGNAFSVKQAVFAGCMTEEFGTFSQTLQTEIEKRGKKGIKLTQTSLNGKEVFVACNLLITDGTIKTARTFSTGRYDDVDGENAEKRHNNAKNYPKSLT